jgi:FlaA1/EpsC-like NDP-sugar epimerase
MVELSGLSVRDTSNPGGDIEIVITGLRPGEKLYEELMLGDDPKPTKQPKIKQAQDPFIPWRELEAHLRTLKTLRAQNDVKGIARLLEKLVVGYRSSGAIVDWVYDERLQRRNRADNLGPIKG